ncbi:unnamed protein product, partial [Citrullus colocynthis]
PLQVAQSEPRSHGSFRLASSKLFRRSTIRFHLSSVSPSSVAAVATVGEHFYFQSSSL